MGQDLTRSRPSEESEPVALGQWYWIRGKEEVWLGCVTWVGSNYIEVTGLNGGSCRIHFDEFPTDIDHRELDPQSVIDRNVEKHRRAVDDLMDDIKRLTAKLGLTPAGELPGPSDASNHALVAAHNTADVKAHKAALIKAQKETLPQLFEKVEEQHKAMAMWMKAKLIPMKAEAEVMKKKTESIEDRIFVVELYAGLCEELVTLRDGEPAGNDEKIHLFQRRHYMDEECLVNYEAGGMEFKNIEAFDKWLMKKPNRDRIFPMPKCVVAFQVRRNEKHREVQSLWDFISFSEIAKLDKLTFLYIRNGDKYYRLSTEIDFGPQLFPDTDHSLLTGNQQLYVKNAYFSSKEIITEGEYLERMKEEKRKRDEHEAALKRWKKLSKKQREGKSKPYWWGSSDTYVALTPATVYYDDAMRQLADDAKSHNRIAVVLQGLLDRSPAFHPHPPWRLWTPEGFSAGIVLHYDDSRGLTTGTPPDFEAYRRNLNASLKVGSNTYGQEDAWLRKEAEKQNAKEARDYRVRFKSNYERYHPYGDPGPGKIAVVQYLEKDYCIYRWERERQFRKWVDNPDRPGWMMRDKSLIQTKFRCPKTLLLNVDAYTPGDYKQFYADPRTRADYIQWAPYLLSAENFHARKDK